MAVPRGARPTLAVILSLLILLGASPALAGGVAIVRTILDDNGDDDGFVDTRETVTMRLEVENTSGIALTDVTAHLNTPDALAVCIVESTLSIGDLTVGEKRVTTGAFSFVLGDVDRSASGLGPYDPLSVEFSVEVTSQPEDQPVHPEKLTLDLDLDVTGGAGATTFVESFEDDLGTFEIEDLDAGRHSLAASDGYRCQYNDPDWVASNNYGLSQFNDVCIFGNSALHADAAHWGLSGPGISPLGGRGFSGFHSLFFGIDLGPPNNWTTPLTTLEAAKTSSPIHLGWDGMHPVLSYKQQVSLVDSRVASLPDGMTYDRGVVMAQPADDLGQPAGPWIKIYPFRNVYDQQNHQWVFNCSFDPTDDGSDEDDFFDPTDPGRRLGPSSTCFPEKIYAHIGETSSPFDPANVGRADGPGLQGIWGIGTWIESRFDLSRFRGRSVRLRYVYSAIQAGSEELDQWEEVFNLGADPGDDGWWIDDVTVSGALLTAATVTVDDADNSALPPPPAEVDPDLDLVCNASDNCPLISNPDQLDADADGSGTACDCADLDATTYPGAPEAKDGLDNQCSGDAGFGLVDEISGLLKFKDETELAWDAQPGATRYQVARASSADFSIGCSTLPFTSNNSITDALLPASGEALYYLTRSYLPFPSGSWGADSSFVERIVPCE